MQTTELEGRVGGKEERKTAHFGPLKPNTDANYSSRVRIRKKSAYKKANIISAPNENSQKASKSVNVLAAGSQDEICVNEHQN